MAGNAADGELLYLLDALECLDSASTGGTWNKSNHRLHRAPIRRLHRITDCIGTSADLQVSGNGTRRQRVTWSRLKVLFLDCEVE